MENIEHKFLRDVRLSQIRHNYVSFSHGFQMNFESLLRNVSYSLGCKTSCRTYRWLGHYNVDKFLSSASTIFSKWEEIAVVFEIQQRTNEKFRLQWFCAFLRYRCRDTESLDLPYFSHSIASLTKKNTVIKIKKLRANHPILPQRRPYLLKSQTDTITDYTSDDTLKFYLGDGDSQITQADSQNGILTWGNLTIALDSSIAWDELSFIYV